MNWNNHVTGAFPTLTVGEKYKGRLESPGGASEITISITGEDAINWFFEVLDGCPTQSNWFFKDSEFARGLVPVHDMPKISGNVDHPSHYNSGNIECIDALEAATTGLHGIEAFCTANAIKYLWRWKRKGGVQDLEKAKWYIDRLIKTVEKKGKNIE